MDELRMMLEKELEEASEHSLTPMVLNYIGEILDAIKDIESIRMYDGYKKDHRSRRHENGAEVADRLDRVMMEATEEERMDIRDSVEAILNSY